MNELPIPLRPTLVWLFLMTTTAATVWLGTSHPFTSIGARFAPSLAITLAFVKAYLVGQDFMEVRGAPAALRVVFGVWIVAFCTAIVTLQAL